MTNFNARVSTSAYSKFAALILLLALLITACSSNKNPIDLSKKILFIGNSYTDYNQGLDYQLLQFAPNSVTARVAPGGYSLQNHWEDANTLTAIRSGEWDVVVLQEQSMISVTDYEAFAEYAKKLDTEIKLVGAETILFMTWQRPDSDQNGVTTEALNNNYTYLGKQLGIKVAPVGLAFANAARERPDLVVQYGDGHPTPQGTYLAAAVFYGVIFDQSPVGISDAAHLADEEASLSEEDAQFLQSIAAQTIGK